MVRCRQDFYAPAPAMMHVLRRWGAAVEAYSNRDPSWGFFLFLAVTQFLTFKHRFRLTACSQELIVKRSTARAGRRCRAAARSKTGLKGRFLTAGYSCSRLVFREHLIRKQVWSERMTIQRKCSNPALRRTMDKAA